MVNILALLDNRAGNNTQVLGVAEKLGFSFEIIRLKYNALARLPSVLLGASGWFLTAETKKQIKELTNPRILESSNSRIIVISAGRRAALAARFIKQKIPNAFLCCLMKPDAAEDAFDLIALPEHDRENDGQMGGWADEKIKKEKSTDHQPSTINHQLSSNDQQLTTNNYFYTLTSPHPLTDTTLENERSKWLPLFEGKPKPWIGVLVGGTSKHAEFSDRDFAELSKQLAQIRNASGGTLFITTSRRTSVQGEKALRQYLFSQDVLYSYAEGSVRVQSNPYFGYLACADVLVVTGDSISMASEACFTGKPSFIYSPEKDTTQKFAQFREQLFKRGYAKPFQNPLVWDWKPSARPDAAMEIANHLKERLKLG